MRLSHQERVYNVLCVCVKLLSHVSSLQSYGLQPARLLCPWNFSGKNTGTGCHFLLQEIFPTQGSLGSPALADEFFTTLYILIKEKYNIVLEIFTSTGKSHKILLLLCLIDIQNHHFHHWIHIGKYQDFPVLPEQPCINQAADYGILRVPQTMVLVSYTITVQRRMVSR